MEKKSDDRGKAGHDGENADEKLKKAKNGQVDKSETATADGDPVFDEPDDELEEFDEIGGDVVNVDSEVALWDEDWDAAGWDAEDENDEFVNRLQKELQKFKADYLKKQPAAASSAAKASGAK